MVNVKNIASETYFYDTAEDVDQKLEKTLSDFESNSKRAYDKLIAEEELSCLTTSEEAWVTAFIATQLVRTKQQRLKIKDIIRRNVIRQIRQDFTGREAPTKIQEFLEQELNTSQTKEGVKFLHIKAFRRVPELVKELRRKKWILLINLTTIPYWSSDHPVNAPNVESPWSDFSSPMIQMQIPLSPKVSIWLCNPIMYDSLHSKYEIMDIEKIRFLNSLQVYWSTRYVFSNENDFSLAEQLIRDDPFLRDLDRIRVPIF